MCGIIGSKKLELFESLMNEVSQRGTRAYTVCVLVKNKIRHYFEIPREFSRADWEDHKASINSKLLKSELNVYWIAHFQSPTAQKFSYHPAMDEGRCLWHNGMIESFELEKYKDETGRKPWDTKLLLNTFLFEATVPIDTVKQSQNLNAFPGSFACLFLDPCVGLYAFRNRISPLFYDDSGTVCSVSFENSKKIEPNTVYEVPSMRVLGTFNNTYNPYGI